MEDEGGQIGYSSNQSNRCGGEGGATQCFLYKDTSFSITHTEGNNPAETKFLGLTVTFFRHSSQLVPFFASHTEEEKNPQCQRYKQFSNSSNISCEKQIKQGLVFL